MDLITEGTGLYKGHPSPPSKLLMATRQVYWAPDVRLEQATFIKTKIAECVVNVHS